MVSSSSLPCSLSNVQSSPERMISVAVQAAIDRHLPAELASIEILIFDTFISRLCLLQVHSIQHVPRMARPFLASCLSQEFSAVNQLRLNQWRSGAGIMCLWQDACAEATTPGDTVASEDGLARDNV